jgi:hypothetical protein
MAAVHRYQRRLLPPQGGVSSVAPRCPAAYVALLAFLSTSVATWHGARLAPGMDLSGWSV